jgi:hypothetical protein
MSLRTLSAAALLAFTLTAPASAAPTRPPIKDPVQSGEWIQDVERPYRP